MSDATTDLLDYDDVAPFRRQIKVNGVRYFLLEPSAEDGRVWKNSLAAAAKFDSKGKFVRAENVTDHELVLVGRCVCLAADDGAGPKLGKNDRPAAVGKDLVTGWPSRVVKDLYRQLVEVGNLFETDTAPELRKRIAELQKKLDRLEADDPKARD